MIHNIYDIITLTGEVLFIILYLFMFTGSKQPQEFLDGHPVIKNVIMILVLIGMLRFVLNIPGNYT